MHTSCAAFGNKLNYMQETYYVVKQECLQKIAYTETELRSQRKVEFV